MTTALTLTKGSYTVTIDATQVTDNYSNKISFIKPPQTKQKQSEGPKDNKAIDLLMVTHEILLRGGLVPTDSKSADEVKADLIKIFKGGGVTGQPISVVYSSHPDTPLSMFMEKCMIIENPIDYDPSATENDLFKYDVQITLIEATSI